MFKIFFGIIGKVVSFFQSERGKYIAKAAFKAIPLILALYDRFANADKDEIKKYVLERIDILAEDDEDIWKDLARFLEAKREVEVLLDSDPDFEEFNYSQGDLNKIVELAHAKTLKD